jgi:hypothetical protein
LALFQKAKALLINGSKPSLDDSTNEPFFTPVIVMNGGQIDLGLENNGPQ